jgi:tetratricopeptide (TPR) repeat protein
VRRLLGLLLLGFLAFGFGVCADEVPLIPDIAPISEAAIRAPLVVEKIKKGEFTAEEAWQKGELNEEMLFFLLNQEGGDKGSLNQVDSAGLSDELVEIMVRYLPERVTRPELLSEAIRFRLAVYYFERDEAQAEALLSDLVELSEKAEGQKKAMPWFYPASLTRLGELYYHAQQHQKALDIFQSGLTRQVGQVYKADWMLMSASIAYAMGDNEKAREFYNSVEQYGDDWFTGVAVYDQANRLIDNEKHTQARQVIEKTRPKLKAARVQAILLSLLAFSFYRTSNFEESAKYSRQSIALFNNLPSSETGLGVKDSVNQAFECLEWINEWKKQAIVCWPKEVQLEGDRKIQKTINIRTFPKTEIVVASSDPHVKATLVGEWQESESGFYFDRKLVLDIDSKNIQEVNTTVVISDAQRPEKKAEVRVLVQTKEIG